MPHICGGLIPPGFDTEKVSVRHRDASVTATPPATVNAGPPARVAPEPEVIDEVDGPEIMNWLKSKRSWQMKGVRENCHCQFISLLVVLRPIRRLSNCRCEKRE